MGIHQLPSWHDSWKREQDSSVSFFSEIMCENRFNKMLLDLHINDNDRIPATNYEKFDNTSSLIAGLNDKFIEF